MTVIAIHAGLQILPKVYGTPSKSHALRSVYGFWPYNGGINISTCYSLNKVIMVEKINVSLWFIIDFGQMAAIKCSFDNTVLKGRGLGKAAARREKMWLVFQDFWHVLQQIHL